MLEMQRTKKTILAKWGKVRLARDVFWFVIFSLLLVGALMSFLLSLCTGEYESVLIGVALAIPFMIIYSIALILIGGRIHRRVIHNRKTAPPVLAGGEILYVLEGETYTEIPFENIRRITSKEDRYILWIVVFFIIGRCEYGDLIIEYDDGFSRQKVVLRLIDAPIRADERIKAYVTSHKRMK